MKSLTRDQSAIVKAVPSPTENRWYELFSRDTQAIIYNYQIAAVQRMLDFDYACSRETPSVAAIVYPQRQGFHKCFFGTEEVLIPFYTTVEEAAKQHPNADVLINAASFRSAYQPSLDALRTDTIRTVVIIAEGVPERQTRQLIAEAKQRGKWIIGPATVGGIKPGAFKIGNTAGTIQNIVETKLYAPGFVGFVSKSGGMSNEMYNVLSRTCAPAGSSEKTYPALYEGISVGGDRFAGSTIVDHLLRFEANPNIKMLVALGEVGGDDELEIVKALKAGKITKPLVMWVVGTCAKLFRGEVQFGHAGAMAASEAETANAKNDALRQAGAFVPRSYDEFGEMIGEVHQSLLTKQIVQELEIPQPPRIPMGISEAIKQGLVRTEANFTSTISDDRGEELKYNGVEISTVIENGLGVGGTIGLLWFKKELPKFARNYLDMILVLVADHGPAVSGAHNAIVAARAGKDLISAVASGLLTIGPRFGGAIDDAGRYFKQAVDGGVTPADFVADMKDKGIPIPGVGHRVKSIHNPDRRVELLKRYAQKHFRKTRYLDYALEVEKLTTAKKANLILNVDGCVGATFLDMLYAADVFSEAEVAEIVDLGFLNGLFVIGRCIGMVGHVMDQKRLKQPLYRHPWEDITYITS
jgi:succinyl-CoA synthetase alpha subunit